MAAFLPVLASTAAVAQEASRAPVGAWFDGGGSEVNISSKSFVYDRLKPGTRPVMVLVELFRDACLQVPVGTEPARPALEARASWGFRFLDADARVSSGGKLDGWQADDVSVTSQPRTWPLAECNVLADRSAHEDLAPVVARLSELLSAEPDKRYKARSADGRHLDGETARWTVAAPAGGQRHVYASSYTDLNGSFALHIGLTEARPK